MRSKKAGLHGGTGGNLGHQLTQCMTQSYIEEQQGRLLRKEQCQDAATRRKDAVEEIMRADNKECETQDQIREGWAEHFQRLVSPFENTRFDKEYKQIVDLHVEAIVVLCREESSSMDPVTEAEVASALKGLNNNKAADIIGLTSKLLKLAGIETIELIDPLLNYIIRSRSISAVLKEGILTPIYKKVDPSDPGNYRGITVTPVYLKILENILNACHIAIYQETQSLLQKWFTPGCSSLNDALILTECLPEAGNNKSDVFVTTLNTQKAFDVVDQNLLLRRL